MPKIIIKSTNLELTDDIKDYVNKKYQKFFKYFNNILSIQVELEKMLKGHHNKGKLFRAEVILQVPHKVLRVEKKEEDLFKAIDKIQDSMNKIIKEYKGKLNNYH